MITKVVLQTYDFFQNFGKNISFLDRSVKFLKQKYFTMLKKAGLLIDCIAIFGRFVREQHTLQYITFEVNKDRLALIGYIF